MGIGSGTKAKQPVLPQVVIVTNSFRLIIKTALL